MAELWSILDWAAPGLLGTLDRFRHDVAVPVERYHDEEATARLIEALDQVATGEVTVASRDAELDGVTIDAYMAKHRLSWRDPKVSLMDLQYHDIRPDHGLYFRLLQRESR